eukprot:13079529-Alexandrium_andersonii.AAC.1
MESAVSPDELSPPSHSPPRPPPATHSGGGRPGPAGDHAVPPSGGNPPNCGCTCLLYTSDAADDM